MRDLAQRFWEKVDIRGTEECWPWLAARSAGYGRFTVSAQKCGELAHRLAVQLTTGEEILYTSKVVLHDCDNPACCNPRHLRVGTQQDNIRDMLEKGRGNTEGLKWMQHRIKG